MNKKFVQPMLRLKPSAPCRIHRHRGGGGSGSGSGGDRGDSSGGGGRVGSMMSVLVVETIIVVAWGW